MDRTLIRTYLYAYIAAKTLDGRPDRAAIDAVLPAVREQLGILDRAVERDRLSRRQPVHLCRHRIRRQSWSGSGLRLKAPRRCPRRVILPPTMTPTRRVRSFAATVPPPGPPGWTRRG